MILPWLKLAKLRLWMFGTACQWIAQPKITSRRLARPIADQRPTIRMLHQQPAKLAFVTREKLNAALTHGPRVEADLRSICFKVWKWRIAFIGWRHAVSDSPAFDFNRNCDQIGPQAAPISRAFRPISPASIFGGMRPRVSWLEM